MSDRDSSVRVYYFAAEDYKDVEEWIKEIDSAIKVCAGKVVAGEIERVYHNKQLLTRVNVKRANGMLLDLDGIYTKAFQSYI